MTTDQMWTSHEALLLDYELPLLRAVHEGLLRESTHMTRTGRRRGWHTPGDDPGPCDGMRAPPGRDRQGLFFSSRRRHTRSLCDWSSDVCSSDLSAAWAGSIPSRGTT